MTKEKKIKISIGRIGAKINKKKISKKKVRAKPGTTGEGNFYRINIRPASGFVLFRNHDVGKKGHLERIAGKRKNNNWDTQCWLVNKKDAKVENNTLIGKTKAVKDLINTLGSKPKLIRGDIFKAKVEKNVPEKDKPTPKMKKAQMANIKKAQAARHK